MKKSLLTIAAAATMVAPAIAMADATLYGNLHLTILDVDEIDNPFMTSNTSAIGVKGSEALGDGLKAIYKVEFGIDTLTSSSFSKVTDAFTAGSPTKGTGSLGGRDQFVGLKGGMGTIKFGTMSSNYKQLGGKNDSLYRTPVEGRGFMHTQSNLHNGRDINRGRMTNAVQYVSPKMGGVQLVLNTTVSGAEDETFGGGIRWSNKNIMAYLDFIDTQPTGSAGTIAATDTESATKVGVKYKTKAFHAGLQYEDAEDVTAFNYIHFNAGYNINKNNSVQVTVGTATFEGTGTAKDDTESFAVAYNHSLSKLTNVYVAYGDVSDDSGAKETDALAFGIKKKF